MFTGALFFYGFKTKHHLIPFTFVTNGKMVTGLSIKDLENLSGIKAHTIRMWEKRYNIFDPSRTKTNIRQYTNDDLRKLLNIASISEHGMKISKISSLSENELNEQIEDLLQENIDAGKKIIINELIVATLKCDGTAFENLYSNYIGEHGLEKALEDIIHPMLVRIGLMWTVSKLNPSQEHFASQLVKQKLFSAINTIPTVTQKEKYVLFLPDGESHEIGLLYAYFLIKKAGNECIYLGASVPLNDVNECSANANATNIICAFTLPRRPETIKNYLLKLSDKFQNKKVLVHGVNKEISEAISLPNITFLNNIQELKNLL